MFATANGGLHHGEPFITKGMQDQKDALAKGGELRIMHPGKTKRDIQTGAHDSLMQNRESRRTENKRRAGTLK